jgi:phospholipid/cholesterol/gamma-HCH transport system substrate-binding protein
MKRAIVKNSGNFSILIGLIVVATGIAGWILVQQRLRLPFQSAYIVKAEFEQTSGLLPGLGQPVNVAGVKVGTVANVKLRNGRALASLEIRPNDLKHVYANGHATMVPNSPVKDIVVELDPGGPPAPVLPEDGVIPVARTATQIELDELWSSLDTDTRQYFSALVGGLGRGTAGRAKDARAVFKSLGPTAEQIQPLMAALAERRHELRRFVHNFGVVAKSAGSKDRELARLVVNANRTLSAMGGQEAALRASLAKLPGTLSATRASLRSTSTFADQLGPAVQALLPTARRLPSALRATRPLLDTAEPVLRRQLRPFVREALPLVKSLSPTISNLDAVTPSLTESFKVLTYAVNTVAYNPPGDNEGYLFWLAWFMHNANSMLSTGDANGALWRAVLLTDCKALAGNPALAQLLDTLLGSAC